MPLPIQMPKLSDTMTEGTLLKWKVKEGDKIAIGQEMAEVQTDKATMVMEAFDEGILFKILIKEGEIVPLMGTMAILLEEGEDPSQVNLADFVGGSVGAATGAAAPAQAKAASSTASKAGTATNAGGRVKASPLAKKIAAEKGLDLARIQGSGPGGRIVAADVENAKPQAAAPVGGGSSLPAIMPVFGDQDTVTPVSPIRKVIANRLLTSKTTIPHFYLHMEVDAGALLALRKSVNESAEANGGTKFTINDFLLKATAVATRAVPAINAAWNGDSIVRYASVGLSVAISVDDGLVTPVIRSAETKTLLEISAAVKDFATRAKANQLKPQDFDGGTLTVSNLGAWGIDMFDAIINPPQAAILSIGAIKKRPFVNAKGEVVAGDRMWIGLSGDHRVVDGAVGAQFLAEVAKLIENPTLMLI